MSVPIFDALGTAWLPGAVLVASLLGSPHCVGMCGGLVLAICPTRREAILYHAGRGVAYASLGGLVGWLGGWILHASSSRPAAAIAAAAMGAALIVLGVRLLQGKGFHFSLVPRAVLSRLISRSTGKLTSPLLLGGLSAVLPCGWLHVFLLGSAAGGSVLSGALLMAVFWLGTLPALASAPWLMRRVLAPLANRAPRAAAVILIAAGLFSLGSKVSLLMSEDSSGAPACHHGMHAIDKN